MAQLGCLVELEARQDREAEPIAFRCEAERLVDDEPGTLPWFALRRGPLSYAIFDVFIDEEAREVHLHGKVGTELETDGPGLLRAKPVITPITVEAAKMPPTALQ